MHSPIRDLNESATPAERALLACFVIRSGGLLRDWAGMVLDAAALARGDEPLLNELAVWTVANDLTPGPDGCRALIADSSMAGHTSPEHADDEPVVALVARLARLLAAGVLAPQLDRDDVR